MLSLSHKKCFGLTKHSGAAYLQDITLMNPLFAIPVHFSPLIVTDMFPYT